MPRGAPKAHAVAAVPDQGWVALKSSNTIGACFLPYEDGDKGALWVAFGGPNTPTTYYAYSGVPRWVYEELISAPSHGVYHDRMIKWKYPFSGPIAAS
jgi:hypothetical protein